MTTDLDRAVRSSLNDIIATAPEPDDQPMQLVAFGGATSTRRPYLAVAASLVVLAGVGGLVAIRTNNDDTPVSPAAAPAATDNPSETAATTAPTTTTLPGQPVSSAVVNPTPNCSITDAQSLVPNVAGMSWVDAAADLLTAGFEPNALPELPAPLATPDADYVIIRQAAAPGAIAPCGATVDIIVAYRPGILYVVQDGDTYESIASSQGITLEQLLSFNGMTVAELEAAGQSPSAPLALGQALRLSLDPATSNTVPTDALAAADTATTTTMP